MALLEVKNLSVRYEPKAHRALNAVEDVSFSIDDGEFVGLIGESGSGKTTLGMALLRLLEKPGKISAGQILFNGNDITTTSQDDLRRMRWREMSTVFQSSMNSLNPVVRIEGQFRDVIEFHSTMRGEAVTRRVRELFDMVRIDPEFINAFPHELSGGMKQRVNLALALADEPRFVLLDEPTTGLGRGRPARDPRERAAAPDRERLRRPLHQPRHRHCARLVGPDHRHVCRKDRRGAGRPRAPDDAAASVLEGPARVLR